ncbi:MAG: aminopeptidase P family protein [Proteobacteria bacterium]|nr:aminopeptidase P family protein [Pseudomonadota bacterium]
MNNTKEKLSALRQIMAEQQLDYYFVPARDAHNNEYVPDCWQRRAWLTDFTGSAGDALIGREQAYLWTDSRYFLQAEHQLDSHYYQLMKQAQGSPPLHLWFTTHCQNKTVGVDPQLLTITQAQQWQEALANVQGALVAVEPNLVDQIWTNQPPISEKPIRVYPLKFAGLPAQNKINDLRSIMAEKKMQAHVLTLLDSIAWLFNIRGNDIEYNPLPICYAIITDKKAIVFINHKKVPAAEKWYLQSQGVELQPYEDFAAALNQLQGTVWIDPNSASWWLIQQLKQAALWYESSPVIMMKAKKNPTELANMHEAHRRDALAVVKFLHWLENTWPSGVTEISAADQLELFRRQDPECLDLSFATISGFASNGAIIHYRATETTSRVIDDSNLYLIDSGGQYGQGTTDITRTIHLGLPTQEQITHYTLVLKGHLALRHTLFPAGTCGEHLDAIARHPLWQKRLNYGHGTGHGVGCYLCVHEGPQRISPGYSKIPLEPSMIVSNEPGIYFTDQYGIRIENLCAIIQQQDHFYTFEDLTKVPYARNLIDINLLSANEIAWIDQYHQQIYELLIDDLEDDQRVWLASATAPLTTG